MQVFIYKYKFWICVGIFVNRGKLMVMIIQSAFSHHMFDNTVHLLWLCVNSRFFMVFTGSVPWGGYFYWVDFKVFYVCMIPIEPVFPSQLAITWFVASEMNQVPCVSTNMVSCSWVSFILILCTHVSVLACQFLLSVFPFQCFSIHYLTCPFPFSLHLFPSLVCLFIYFLFSIMCLSVCSVLFPVTPSWSAFPHVATRHCAAVFRHASHLICFWFLVSCFLFDLILCFSVALCLSFF